MDSPIYVNTISSSQDPAQEGGDDTPQRWIARCNDKIIGFYDSQSDALNGLRGHRMSNVVGIGDELEVRQII